MRKEYSQGFKMRGILSEIFMERNMPLDMIAKIVRPMRGKTQEEKEQIAEQIIQELTNNTNSEPTL